MRKMPNYKITKSVSMNPLPGTARCFLVSTHLVNVHSLSRSDPPAFADIVDLVQEDWEEMRLQELNEKYFEGLMSRYEIVIEHEGNQESDG